MISSLAKTRGKRVKQIHRLKNIVRLHVPLLIRNPRAQQHSTVQQMQNEHIRVLFLCIPEPQKHISLRAVQTISCARVEIAGKNLDLNGVDDVEVFDQPFDEKKLSSTDVHEFNESLT